MAGKIDRYYKIDPWKVIEEGFDPSRSRASESVFSLSNELWECAGILRKAMAATAFWGAT